MSFSNPQETGRPIRIKDEGVLLTSSVGSIDFVGAGVSGSVLGSDVTENISGTTGAPVSGEVPSGTVDGSNPTFTIAQTPISGTFKLFVNGARQKDIDDFILSGTTITFVNAPMVGSNILADYYY